MHIKINSLVIILFILISLFSIVNASSWLEGWDYRYELKIDYTKTDEVLYNFTVLVHLSNNSGIEDNNNNHIFEILGSNYDGIAFTQNHETKMFYEIEYYNSTEELAEIWIMIPEINNITYTYLYLYYDNEIDGSDYNNSVYCWDSSFIMVQHMKDETTSTILDSTSNDNDGTKLAINEPIEVDGQIGKAQEFSGAEYITVLTSDELQLLGNFTVSYWIYPTAITNYQSIVSKFGSSAGWLLWYRGSSYRNHVLLWDGSAHDYLGSAGNVPLNVYSYVVITRLGTLLSFYVNGEFDISVTVVMHDTTIANVSFGYSGAPWHFYYIGLIDEMRLSDGIARSSAWIDTSYETQIDNLFYYGNSENLLSSDIMLIAIIALMIALFSFLFIITQKGDNKK